MRYLLRNFFLRKTDVVETTGEILKKKTLMGNTDQFFMKNCFLQYIFHSMQFVALVPHMLFILHLNGAMNIKIWKKTQIFTVLGGLPSYMEKHPFFLRIEQIINEFLRYFLEFRCNDLKWNNRFTIVTSYVSLCTFTELSIIICCEAYSTNLYSWKSFLHY
jgi:hypothetical protein